MNSFSQIKVFSTTGSEGLATDICRQLKNRLPESLQPEGGLTLGKSIVKRFSNDNIEVQVDDVRGKYVVIVHTQVPPVNDNLVELFALIDAINNARPADLLVVFPYMPFARSDRKNKARISTMGALLPRILTLALDVNRVLLLDPHDSHIKHYFHPTADDVTAIFLLADHLERTFFNTVSKKDCVLVFADAGSAKRYEEFAFLTRISTAYIDKNRPDDYEQPLFNQLIGDVEGKICIIIDDEILTGSTAIGDAEILISRGAKKVIMVAVHPVLESKNSGYKEVIKKLIASPIDQFIISDSIPVAHKIKSSKKFTVVSVAPLLGEAIRRTLLDESLTVLRSTESVELYRPSK